MGKPPGRGSTRSPKALASKAAVESRPNDLSADVPAANDATTQAESKSGQENPPKDEHDHDSDHSGQEVAPDVPQVGSVAMMIMSPPMAAVPMVQPIPLPVGANNTSQVAGETSGEAMAGSVSNSLSGPVTTTPPTPGASVSIGDPVPASGNVDQSDSNKGSAAAGSDGKADVTATPQRDAATPQPGVSAPTPSANLPAPEVPADTVAMALAKDSPSAAVVAQEVGAATVAPAAVNGTDAKAAVPTETQSSVISTSKAQFSYGGSGGSIRAGASVRTSRAEVKAASPDIANESRTDGSVGTAVAPHVRQMSRDDQQNEFADQGKQNLPDLAAIRTPDVTIAAVATTAKPEAQTTIQTPAETVLHSVAQDNNAATATTAMHSSISRLVGEISHEAMILRQLKPDKLDVVLRPDSNTQISLQLRMNGNEVQGTARCERGDFSLLSSHWNELQRTMDQQGVRLAPLKDGGMAMSFSNGNSNFSQTAHDQRARKLEEVVLGDREAAPRPADAITDAIRGPRSVSGRSLLQAWA